MRAISRRPRLLYLIAEIADGGVDGARLATIAAAVREEATLDELTLLVQLRDRNATAGQLFETAASWTKALRAHGGFLIVNERTDVVVTTGAAGVHLSAESYGIDEARTLLPEGIIAYSAHSVAETTKADAAGADLITLSPVFDSPGKGEPIGTAALRECAGSLEAPLLALGGIGRDNAAGALAAGADGIALIRSVFHATDPQLAARDLARLIKKSPA